MTLDSFLAAVAPICPLNLYQPVELIVRERVFSLKTSDWSVIWDNGWLVYSLQHSLYGKGNTFLSALNGLQKQLLPNSTVWLQIEAILTKLGA